MEKTTEKLELDLNEIVERSIDLAEDLTDVAIFFEYLKRSQIISTKELKAIYHNVTLESDDAKNLENCLDTVNRAVGFFDWLDELIMEKEGEIYDGE